MYYSMLFNILYMFLKGFMNIFSIMSNLTMYEQTCIHVSVELLENCEVIQTYSLTYIILYYLKVTAVMYIYSMKED